MRILTNFQDYYDKGLMYGIDELIVYKRLTSKSMIKESYIPSTARFYDHIVRPFVIYFCGESYMGIRFEEVGFDFESKHGKIAIYNTNILDRFLSSVEERNKFIYNFNKYETPEKLKKSTTLFVEHWLNNFKTKYSYRNKREESLLEPLYNKKQINTWCTEQSLNNNVPYFVLYVEEESKYHKKSYIEYNTQLKMWDFNKVKNPQEAFQEISMYVGSVLQQPVNPMIEISNEEMAKKKGFGHKYAFRKEPSKK